MGLVAIDLTVSVDIIHRHASDSCGRHSLITLFKVQTHCGTSVSRPEIGVSAVACRQYTSEMQP